MSQEVKRGGDHGRRTPEHRFLLSLFIFYHPWGNRIFSTAPVGLDVWLILVPFLLLLFAAEEARKFSIRHSGRTTPDRSSS